VGENQWAVTVGASGVQANTRPGAQDGLQRLLLDQVKGILPDGAVVEPLTVAPNRVIFEPPLPPGSKVFTAGIFLGEILEYGHSAQQE